MKTTRKHLRAKAAVSVIATLTALCALASPAGATSTGGWCNGKRATHNTTISTVANNTVYRGSSGNDVIVATVRSFTPGAVIVYGLGGNDTICIVGHEGTVWGGGGNDVIIGGPYVDSLHGQGGHDTIKGNGSPDYISGGWGQDKLYGGWGNDEIDGGAGWDQAWGYNGSDRCRGVERRNSCER